MSVPRRLAEIDQVRGIAIVAVLILHTLPTAASTRWINDLVFRHCVPIFLMLMPYNGLLSYRRRTLDRWVTPGAGGPVTGGAAGRATLAQSYDLGHLRGKLQRLLVPFAILWIASLVIGLLYHDTYLGPLLLLGYLPHTGPGNYFVVMALEFALIAPLLFWGHVRRPKTTLVVLVAVDLAF